MDSKPERNSSNLSFFLSIYTLYSSLAPIPISTASERPIEASNSITNYNGVLFVASLLLFS